MTTWSDILTACVVTVVCGLTAAPCSELTANDVELARACVDSELSSYERLVSYRLNVVEVRKGMDTAAKHQCTQVADKVRGVLRYDHETPHRKIQCAINDRFCLVHVPFETASRSSITRYPSVYRNVMSDARYIDVRYFWFGYPGGYSDRINADRIEKSYRRIVHGNSTLKEVIESTDEGTVQLVWEFNYGEEKPTGDLIHGRLVKVFDSKKAMAPVLVQDFQKFGSGSEWRLGAQAEAKWELQQEMWLPVHWTVSNYQTRSTVSVQLAWESVNESFSDDLFEIEGFAAPDGTQIYDFIDGESVFVGEVGSFPIEPSLRVESDNEAPVHKTWRSMLFIVVSLSLVVVVSICVRRIVNIKRGRS